MSQLVADMRVMLDTNIIVSAVLFPESKLAQSTLELSDRYKLVICDNVIAELRDVMQRKFPKKAPVCEHADFTKFYLFSDEN